MSKKITYGLIIDEMISGVKECIKRNDLTAIKSYLEDKIQNPEAIINALPEFDCEEVLLYSDSDVTVYYIATPPKILYPPHEHGMIAISALYSGTETHVFYDREGENIQEKSRVSFEAPSVVDLNIDAVHAICTNDNVPNAGIHFYLGDLENQSRNLWDVDGTNPRQYVHEDYLKSAKPFEA